MKRHISYFYNALLEYYPVHQAWCKTWSSSRHREWKGEKQIDSHTVCWKCPPLAETQARKCVGH